MIATFDGHEQVQASAPLASGSSGLAANTVTHSTSSNDVQDAAGISAKLNGRGFLIWSCSKPEALAEARHAHRL